MYDSQSFQVINAHYFSHFEKPNPVDSMDSYRKNKSPFDYSKENRRALSRREYVAPKVGYKDINQSKDETRGKLIFIIAVNEVKRLRPQKVLDGEGIGNQKMDEYEKDVKYFSSKSSSGKKAAGVYTSRKAAKALAYMLPNMDSRKSGIIEKAEEQRMIRHKKGVSMALNKIQANVKLIIILVKVRIEKGNWC